MASSFLYGATVLVALMTGIMPVEGVKGQEIARQYRPDAEGYPCAARDKLMIAQEDQSFTIRPVANVGGPAAQPPIQRKIGVGASMKLDAALLGYALPSHREAANAARR
jgi:hypothetical protein